MVLAAGPQILSLPVDAGATEHPGAVADFLDRGGWVAWGAVPTDRPLGETAEIVLLNPMDYFLYLPLLPEVSAGSWTRAGCRCR